MKIANYQLSKSDVRAISSALSVLPSYDFFATMPEQITCLPLVVVEKLVKNCQLKEQDIYIIAIAVDSAYKALRNEISFDSSILSELQTHMFTINKLFPVFARIL